MVERSSTSAVTYFGSYGSRPIDRALGAAATLSIGVFLFRLLNRYVRRLQDGKKDPWITALLSLIRRRSVEEEQSSLTDTAVHRGTCHCRSVTFEVSCVSVNMFHSSLGFSRGFVTWRLTVMHNSVVFYASSEVQVQSRQRMVRERYTIRTLMFMLLIFGSSRVKPC